VFLETVMNSELELPMGRWVASTAISRLSEWRARGLDLIVSINVSPLQLLQNDFLCDLESLLKEYPTLGPADLELEILESTAISEMSRAVNVIEEGRGRGFRFSLDDFGTGYSSLAHFRQLPVDVLKVDRSFVQSMTESREDHEIVDSIVRLAHAFNREVIAEGVETVEQGRALLKMGCLLGQGYGLGVPMSGEDFLVWLEHWERENPWRN
jgi:EAL domain-containing protein (putative c-di-GMP-specific phosphodiesterase class I)